MKKKFDKSNSIKNKKVKRRMAQDDFNILLPDDEQKAHRCNSSDEEEIRKEME